MGMAPSPPMRGRLLALAAATSALALATAIQPDRPSMWMCADLTGSVTHMETSHDGAYSAFITKNGDGNSASYDVGMYQWYSPVMDQDSSPPTEDGSYGSYGYKLPSFGGGGSTPPMNAPFTSPMFSWDDFPVDIALEPPMSGGGPSASVPAVAVLTSRRRPCFIGSMGTVCASASNGTNTTTPGGPAPVQPQMMPPPINPNVNPPTFGDRNPSPNMNPPPMPPMPQMPMQPTPSPQPYAGQPDMMLYNGNPCYGCGSITLNSMNQMAWVGGVHDEVCFADTASMMDGTSTGVTCGTHPRVQNGNNNYPSEIHLRNVTLDSSGSKIYYIASYGESSPMSQLCWADVMMMQTGKITGIYCSEMRSEPPGSMGGYGPGMMGLQMVGIGNPPSEERLFFGWNDHACTANPMGLTAGMNMGIACIKPSTSTDMLVGGSVGVSGDGLTMAWATDASFQVCKVTMTHPMGSSDSTFGTPVCTGMVNSIPQNPNTNNPVPMVVDVPSVSKDGKFAVWGDGGNMGTGSSVCAVTFDQITEGGLTGVTCSNNQWHPVEPVTGEMGYPTKVKVARMNRLYWFISSPLSGGADPSKVCAGWVFEPPTHTPTPTMTTLPTGTTLPTYTPAYNNPADAASFPAGAVADSSICKAIKRLGSKKVEPHWNVAMTEGDTADPFVAIGSNEFNAKQLCFGRYSELTADPGTYKCTAIIANSDSYESVLISGTNIIYRTRSKTCVLDTTVFVHQGTTGVKCTAAETTLVTCTNAGPDREGCGHLVTRMPGGKFLLSGSNFKRICVGDAAMMVDGTWDGIVCTADIMEDLLGPRLSADGNTAVVGGKTKYCVIDIPAVTEGTLTGVRCITTTAADPGVDISADGMTVSFGTINYVAHYADNEFRLCTIATADIVDGADSMANAQCAVTPRNWLHSDAPNLASAIVYWAPGRIVFTTKWARAFCWVDPMHIVDGSAMGVQCTKQWTTPNNEWSPLIASPDKSWFAFSRIGSETCLVTPWMMEPMTYNGVNCITYSGYTNKPGGVALNGGKLLIGTQYEAVCLVDVMPAVDKSSRTPTPTPTRTPTPVPPTAQEEAHCNAITDCGDCQAESGCGYCSSSMMCHTTYHLMGCSSPGCNVGCDMVKPAGFGCRSDSVYNRHTDMCRCKGKNRNYCDATDHMCKPKAECDTEAEPGQPCMDRATRPPEVGLNMYHNCTCNERNGNVPNCVVKANGRTACVRSRDWSNVNGGATGNVAVEEGSTIDVNTDESYTGATVNVGTGSGDCSMTNTGASDSTLTVNDLQVGVNTFTTDRVAIMAQYMLLSTPLFWSNPRVTVLTSMTISSTTTFSDEDGNSDLTVDGGASIHTQPNAPTTFGSRYTQSPTATATFEDDVEFSGQSVDLAGSVSLSRKVLFRSPYVTLAAVTTAVTTSATMEVEGGTVTVTSTAVINMFLFVRHNTIGTGTQHRRRRQAATMAADPTGYGVNMPAAGTFNAPVSADNTFLSPTFGVAFNSDLRLGETSLLYLDDSWDPPASNFLNIVGTFTCENCKIELDFGNSATAASFPADTTLTVLEAGDIMGAAHVSVAAGEGISGDFVWTTEKVSVAGGRWQLRVTKHATPGPIISGPLLRSGLMAVTVKDSLVPGMTEASYAADITTRVNTLFARNGGMWTSVPFTVTVHKLMASPHPGHTIAYFTFTSTAEAMMDYTWWIQAYFKYHMMDFGAMHEVKMQSTKFQCVAADSPATDESIYACNDDYFASEATCATQSLTDTSCGADRKESCSVRPEDSTNCWLVAP